jgi:hypothetical protein
MCQLYEARLFEVMSAVKSCQISNAAPTYKIKTYEFGPNGHTFIKIIKNSWGMF